MFGESANENKKVLETSSVFPEKVILFSCLLKSFPKVDFCSHIILLSKRFESTEEVNEANVFCHD